MYLQHHTSSAVVNNSHCFCFSFVLLAFETSLDAVNYSLLVLVVLVRLAGGGRDGGRGSGRGGGVVGVEADASNHHKNRKVDGTVDYVLAAEYN